MKRFFSAAAAFGSILLFSFMMAACASHGPTDTSNKAIPAEEQEAFTPPEFQWPSTPVVIRPPDLGTDEYYGGYAFSPEGLYLARYRLENNKVLDPVIFLIEPSSGEVHSMRSIDAGIFPRALCIIESELFVLTSNRLFILDRITLETRHSIDLRPLKPSADWYFRGMATPDGETFYLTFAKDNAVYRFIRSTGAFERWCGLPESAAPRALALNGGELYAFDPFHLLIYVIDPASAKITGEALFSRRSGYDAAAFLDGTLYMYDRKDAGIWRFPMQKIGDSIIRSDPVRVRVRARLTVRNRSQDSPVTGIRCVVAVPVTEVHQTIESITYQGPTPSLERDRYGQLTAVFDVPQISPGEETVVGWTADAVIWSVRHRITPSNLEPLADIPSDIASLYGTTSYFRLSEGDPALDQLARDIAVNAGDDPVSLVRSTRNAVMDRLTYELHYPWREAAEILRVGKGTCGEYSFLTSALLRRNGLPTRFIGASTNRDLTPCTDEVHHGWIEVYLPGYGWAPMDTNFYDNDKGPPYRNQLVFGESLNMLILSRGGHEDETYLGPNYNYEVNIASGSTRSGIAYEWEIR